MADTVPPKAPAALPSVDQLRLIAKGLRTVRFAAIVPAGPIVGKFDLVEARGLNELFAQVVEALADARERIAKLEAKG